MEKFLKHLMLLLVATFSLTLTSCGGNDEPNKPNTSSSDITYGSVSEITGVVLTSDQYGGPYFSWCGSELRLDCDYNGYSYVKMVSVGEVSKLNDIKAAPAEGWSTRLPLEDNNGYIITYTYEGRAYYIRMLITHNRSAAGDLIGIDYQFQHFTPSNI